MSPIPSPGHVLDRLLLQVRIVVALAHRDILLKAGKKGMGLFGVFLEPMFLVATLLLLRIFLRQAGGNEHMSALLWLSTGFISFFMFSDVAIKALNGVNKNSDLFFYQRIRPLDTLLASVWMNTQIYGMLLLVITTIDSAMRWQPSFQEPGLAIFYLLFVPVLGFGMGLSTLILGHRLPILSTLLKVLLRRVMIFTSCTFFPISMIPEPARPVILWNPLAHGIELIRHAANPHYPIPGISATYFILCTIASAGVGLFIYSNNEDLLNAID
ncbi:MAG: ABC transporter permease [Prochlorococcaceae cyanobacterium]